jgi:thiaminase/transcriptional activator TenA
LAADRPVSLAQQLWQANADWADRILAHPFVQGLGDGSLPVAAFKSYVAQDAWFLEAFARAYAFCLAHGTSRDDLFGFSELIAGVLDELKLHRSYTERLDIPLDDVTPLPATQAYVEFLLGTARHGQLGETIAGMTPCMRLYAFLGRTLAKKEVAPAYADWVKTYADPGFEALAVRLEALLDRHAVDSPVVRLNYRRAMELEYNFFDANR